MSNEMTDPGGGEDAEPIQELSREIKESGRVAEDGDSLSDYMGQIAGNDEDQAEEESSDSGSDSTCTILNQDHIWSHSCDEKVVYFEKEGSQIVNVSDSLDTNAYLEEDKKAEGVEENPLVEIDLNEESSQLNATGNTSNQLEEPTSARDSVREMFATYHQPAEEASEPMRPSTLVNHHHHHHHHHQQQQQHHHLNHSQQHHYPHEAPQFKGFNEAQPKLSFASQRVKEYFESFKSHRGETVRLYQFFKSTRTELVACLLFSLISSQALIVLRSNLTDQSAYWPAKMITWSPGAQSSDGNDASSSSAQAVLAGSGTRASWDPILQRGGGNNNNNNNNAMIVHLANGLVMSFTVASLTQVFGHISGCHLIPSVSLALYIKGHISRARLASYLAAQFLGSGLGVALLSLLSSSQISPDEYRQTLLAQQTKYNYPHRTLLATHPREQQQPIIGMNKGASSRKKRDSAPPESPLVIQSPQLGRLTAANGSGHGLGAQSNDEHDINLGEFQGSETILLSIMEQQQELQRRGSPTLDNERPAKEGGGLERREKTITVKASTYPPEPAQVGASPVPGAHSELGGGPKLDPLATPPTQTTATAASTVGSSPFAAAATTTTSSPSGSSLLTVQLEAGGPVWPSLTTGQYLAPSSSSSLSASGEPQRPSGRASDYEGPPNDRSRVLLAAAIPTTTSSSTPTTDATATTTAISVWPQEDPSSSSQSPPPTTAELEGSVQRQEPQAGLHGGLIGGNSVPEPGGGHKRVKLRRRKRNRKQQQQLEVNSYDLPLAANLNGTNNNNNNNGPADGQSKFYINLLEFTLPDQIMSSESIRQCLDKQQQQQATEADQSQPPPIGAKWAGPERHRQQQQQQQEVLQLAGRSFGQCLSLSNSSQMFVFQFMAALLVVLTYLVNVDPRRVDLGFKSLSIGLAYFVACILTVHSGGFFGNPFHLLFLNWLSTTSQWRSEWFIYLITPLISGVFGAISHEYIDFSSLRNRNKQLHLRRSFYSLENLPQFVANGTAGGSGGSGADGQRSDSHTTVMEIASLSGNGATRNRSRKASASSSSLEGSTGAASSMMSLNGPDPVVQPQTSLAPTNQTEHHLNLNHQPNSSNNHHHHYSNIHLGHYSQTQGQQPHQQKQQLGGAESFGTNRKLISYSRQLRMEQQRAARHHQANGAPVSGKASAVDRASLRRSDFDSNFLISSSCSSPPTATRRQIHTSGWM